MTNSNRASVQRLLQRNKYAITHLHTMLVEHKEVKRLADVNGDLQTEYAYHNAVQYIKKELRNYVKEQKMLKGMLRDELFEYSEI